VQLHELLGQRKPEACPPASGRHRGRPGGILADARLILGRDPDSRVADRDRVHIVSRLGGETRPPSGMNFTALESRFKRICLTLRSSATMSATLGSTVCVSVIPCRVARSRIRVRALSLDRSRMSLIHERKCRPEERMSCRYSAYLSFTSTNIRSTRTSEKPRTACNGVRSSCDM
jgi:hypothetical protein